MILADFFNFIWSFDRPTTHFVTASFHRPPDNQEIWLKKTVSDVAGAVAAVGKYRKDKDTFHAIAGYQPGTKKRTRDNVLACRCLVIDLDVHRPGSSKPNTYATQQEALADLTAFVRQASLPNPNMFVSTGWGIHAYWVLDTPLAPAHWQPLADGLRNAAVTYGLKFDHAVTTTSNRVLRTPETWNFKHPTNHPAASVLRCTERWIPLAAISHVASVIGTGAPRARPLAPGSTLNSDITDMNREPTPVRDLVKRCPVMEHMARTGGNYGGYALWRNMLTLLANTPDGTIALAYEMSKNHPTYSQAALEKQWEDAKTNARDRPATCSNIAGEGGAAAICHTCPHRGKIVSPIQLGGPRWAPPEGPAKAVSGVVQAVQQPAALLTGKARPQPPWGFDVPPQGGCIMGKDEEGEPVKVLGGDIEQIDAVYRREGGALNQTLFLKMRYRPVGKDALTLDLPVIDLDAGKRTYLQSRGIEVGDNSQAMYMLRTWAVQLANATSQVAAIKQFGWLSYGGKTGFVLGDRIYWNDGSVEQSLAQLPGSELYTLNGNLPQWQQAAQFHVDRFSPALQVVVAAAFASPLVKLSNKRGARVLNVTSSETGTGKTTAIALAQSVWGDVASGTVRVNATAHSAIEFFGQLNHLPAFWDEARGMTAAEFVEVVFNIAEGAGRRRLYSNSTMRNPLPWNNMAVITSNDNLRDAATEADSNSANEGPNRARIFECNVPVIDDAKRYEKMSDVSEAAIANWGQAGDAYLRYIVPRHALLEKAIGDLHAGLDRNLQAPVSSRLHISTIATLTVAARCATQAGILNFDHRAIRDYLIEQYRRMMDDLEVAGSRKAGRNSEADDAADFLVDFCSAHKTQTVVTRGNQPSGAGRRMPVEVVVGLSPNVKEPLVAHWLLGEKLLLIERKALRKYIGLRRRSSRATCEQLAKHIGFDPKAKQRALGADTQWCLPGRYVYEIPFNHPAVKQMASGYGYSDLQMPVGPAGTNPYLQAVH